MKLRKRNPGHPRTTGSKSTRPIQFRVSEEERAEVESDATDAGVSVDLLAKQRVLGRATIYALVDPRDDRVRYVGQTKDVAKRFTQHLRSHGAPDARRAWAADLIRADLRPKIIELETCAYSDALDREDYWIAFYSAKFSDLLNGKPGRPRGTRTTGGGDNANVIQYRVSDAQHTELVNEGPTANAAAKRRAFPSAPPKETTP